MFIKQLLLSLKPTATNNEWRGPYEPQRNKSMLGSSSPECEYVWWSRSDALRAGDVTQ